MAKATKTWNQHIVKKENKLLVYQTIKATHQISRADIANQTGLNKGTVSSLVSELIEEDFIYESGPGKSSGGRRPVMLLLNNQSGFSIGIDIGVNYLLGVLTDQSGTIINEKVIHCDNIDFNKMQGELFPLIDFLIKAAPKSPYGIIGIGIAIPGIVNNKGEILLAPNLGWKNINLKALIEAHYDLPVTIENEANAGAYGEKKYGIGNGHQQIVYVSVGIGIGVGLILNGELYRGNHGFSGELGHMTIDIHGKNCKCGKQGCWELYASEQALLDFAKQSDLITDSKEKFTLEDIIEAAEANNSTAITLFETIGKYLGVGINNILNIFNPEQIIIGNRMSNAKQWIEPTIENQIEVSQWFHQKDLRINFSELATHATALGMAAFALEDFINHYFESNTGTTG